MHDQAGDGLRSYKNITAHLIDPELQSLQKTNANEGFSKHSKPYTEGLRETRRFFAFF